MITPRKPKPRSATQIHRAHENAQFRTEIQSLVSDLDQASERVHSFASLHEHYQLRRRRLYDIIHVFLALGCVSRQGIDGLMWHGRRRIFTELRAEKNRLGIDNYSIRLSMLFPCEVSRDLRSLTSALLLLFAALKTEPLDLRKVSGFFSRETDGYRSTLCKLYQIALILGALGITEKGDNVCEIKLLSPFTQLLRDDAEENPLAITNLLNRPSRPLIEARVQEFHGINPAAPPS
jgi:hypothetical protein